MKKEKNNNLKKEIKKDRVSTDKTKLFKGIGVVAIVVLVIALSFVASNSYGAGAASYKFIDITIDEYLEKLNGDEKSIIYIARPTCSFCTKQAPILKKIASKYELEIYYLDTTNFYDSSIQDYTEDGYKLINSSEVYQEGFGTPNTIVVSNGEIIDGVYQYVEASELTSLFERTGFINE